MALFGAIKNPVVNKQLEKARPIKPTLHRLHSGGTYYSLLVSPTTCTFKPPELSLSSEFPRWKDTKKHMH